MKVREDSWTGEWCVSKLQEVEKIDQLSLVNSNFFNAINRDFGLIKVATMSVNRIDANTLIELLSDESVDFVLNVKGTPYITQCALEMSEKNQFGIGGVADAMRALRDGNASSYLDPEIFFVLQGLRQHTRVSSVVRLDNRRFKIDRRGLDSVKVITLNEYELTAEAVRNAIDSFPEFDAILKSNPNGQILRSSTLAAESAGVRVFTWAELLGALNRAW